MDYCGISKIGFMFQKGSLRMCFWRNAMMGPLLAMVAQNAPQHSSRSLTIGLIWKTMQKNMWRFAWLVNKIEHLIKNKQDCYKHYRFLKGMGKCVHGFHGEFATIKGIWCDQFSKMAHFIPTKENVMAQEMGRLFFTHVFKHHGLPKDIMSDWDPKFTSKFWRALWKCMGLKLKMNTSFQP